MARNREDFIKVINNCLELANNKGASEGEIMTATLKAHKLMAKYNITEEDLDAVSGKLKITMVEIDVTKLWKWKWLLADILADNCRCKWYRNSRTKYQGLVFYGAEMDIHVAKTMFEFLYSWGHRKAYKLAYDYIKEYGTGRGVYNSFAQGFVSGVASKLGEQSTALQVVISQDVIEAYEEHSKDFGSFTTRVRINGGVKDRALEEGYNEGRSAISQREVSENHKHIAG